MRAKHSLVGSESRNHAGNRGRDCAGLTGFEAGILSFQLRPKSRQFIRPEVAQDFTVDIDHRRQSLAGKLDHFIVRGFVGNDIDGFIIDSSFVEPAFCFVTPPAIRFDEEADPFRFHSLTVADGMCFFK